VTVTVDIPRPLAAQAARHWSGYTWTEVIGNALMLACAWADQHPTPDKGKSREAAA
jgi:hypothetical protein